MHARTLVCLDAHLDLQYVNPARLKSLEQCTTGEEVKRLEKTHHLLPDQHFSYSLKDFLYPAYRLGMIKHLIWVAPPHVETGYSRRVFDQLEQMEGVLFEELASARKVSGGWVEVRLLGLDITICNYLQLEMLSLPVDSLIDIDIDYFVTVPGDEAWINPRNVFEVLNQLPLKTELVSISRSVSSGFMPLRYRFFADYLAALWENRHQDAAHYERLFHLKHQLRMGKDEAVVTGCRRELEKYPRCATSYHMLSLGESDPDQAGMFQQQAENLCSGYRTDLLRSACEFPSRQLAVNCSKVLVLENELAVVRLSTQMQALAHAVLGLIYCACRQVSHAIRHYRQSTQQLGHHPELALEIGKLLLQSQQAEQAIPFLKEALRDDSIRVSANVLLGQFYSEQGLSDKAILYLQEAHEMAPAWGEILKVLAQIHHQLGNQQQSQTLLKQYQYQQKKIELLAKQFSH